MDAAVEIDVGAARRAEDDAGAGGDAAAGVGGEIVRAEVSFDLDNPALAMAVDQRFAEEGTGDGDVIASVKAFWKGNQG